MLNSRGVTWQVNGYYCRTCADVELAKRGFDPATHRAPGRVGREERASDLRRPPPDLGLNAPGPPGALLGGRLDIYA